MADSSKLYVDPTPAYKPTLDFLQSQEKLANARYGKNKADISNIFGTLTSLTEKDAARIEDQFVQSIKDQQQGLAQRTAEVRNTQATTRQGMDAVAGERGTVDPATASMMTGPTAVDVAAEQGIAASNEYQTTWDALMNVNKQQAQENLRNRIAGYGQQQAGALTALQQNLENRLSELGGSRAQVQSDIAQAKLIGQQNKASAEYNTQVSKEAAAAAKTGAPTTAVTGPTTVSEWMTETDKLGEGMSNLIVSDVAAIYANLKRTADATATRSLQPIVVTKQQLLAAYLARHGDELGANAGIAYISQFSGLK